MENAYFSRADELVEAIVEYGPGNEAQVVSEYGIVATNAADPHEDDHPTLDLALGGPTVTLVVEDDRAVVHYLDNGYQSLHVVTKQADKLERLRDFIRNW